METERFFLIVETKRNLQMFEVAHAPTLPAQIVANSNPIKVISKPLSPMMLVVYGELTKGKKPL